MIMTVYFGNVDVLLRTGDVRSESLLEEVTFLYLDLYCRVLSLSLDLNCSESWRELDRRPADTLSFTLGRSGGVTGIDGLPNNTYLFF